MAGFEKDVQNLIKCGADVNAKDADGKTPLFLCHDKKIANLLVQAGADINIIATDGNPVVFVIDLCLVDYLIKLGANLAYRDNLCNPIERFLDILRKSTTRVGRIVLPDDHPKFSSEREAMEWRANTILLMIEKMDLDSLVNKVKGSDMHLAEEIVSMKSKKDGFFIEKRKEILRAIFKKGLKPTSSLIFDSRGPISTEDLDLFVEYGFDINEIDSRGKTLLDRLREKCGSGIFDNSELRYFAIDRFSRESSKYIRERYSPIIEYLVKKGTKKTGPTVEKENIIHIAPISYGSMLQDVKNYVVPTALVSLAALGAWLLYKKK